MRSLLYGIYEGTIDGSGRLTVSTEALPNVATEDGPAVFYTAIGPNGKIWLYPAACLDDRTANALAIHQRETSPPDLPATLHAWPDGDAGIFMQLPRDLVKQNHLASEVNLIGVRDHFELWNRPEWDARSAALDSRLPDIVRKAASMGL